MIHADKSASGPVIPKKLIQMIPADTKKLQWLGNRSQLQFYEDPVTIDLATQYIVEWFLKVEKK